MGKTLLPQGQSRISVKGKFLYVGGEKFYIKGVTYGTFQPDEHGAQFPSLPMIEKDFSLMASSDINSVRTYTPPQKTLLDIAHSYGLKVMVGLPWEQHIAFLDEEDRIKSIIRTVKKNV